MRKLYETREISCQPYLDQRPGTAGLRKKVTSFKQPHYLQTYIEAIFRTLRMPADSSLIVGGDGRYFSLEAIQIIAEIAIAHGVRQIITGIDGRLATPAASYLIRNRGAAGGLLLTASHNPGGPDGDFGVKFNTASGGQAPESLTEAIYANSRTINRYSTCDLPDLPLSATGTYQFGQLSLEVTDSAADYADQMEGLFNFEKMRDYLGSGHRLAFDALHAVTGPYAREVFCRRLGAPDDCILHSEPLPDFGGFHPDPNPVDAAHLVDLANSPQAPDLIAASDGDGDRNMILGPGLMVSPCDSVAIMLAHASRVPGYTRGIAGVARSMPTSRALDQVAASMDIPCFETPTGWRFFCNLLEAGLIDLCGEESFGTSSSHTREKDGLWAVLFWLNLLAELRQPVGDIVADHWGRFGRHYYQRQDFFIENLDAAQTLINELGAGLAGLIGQSVGGATITQASDFCYEDPVDHSHSSHQGLSVECSDDSRIVYRLSGTGTEGATLRIYLEKYVNDAGKLAMPLGQTLAPLADRAAALARIEHYTGLSRPTAAI
jgi:phosphoglucomutase